METSTPSTPVLAPQSRYPTEPPPSAPSALPHPGTFDVLPQLHLLLARILIPHSAAPADLLPSENPELDAQQQQQQQPLEIQDLATAATSVKVAIQRARNSVKGLPDLDRSVAAQEEEIRELEGEVERLRGALWGVASVVGVGGA